MTVNMKPKLPLAEFVPLLAFMISLVAMSIDAVLPALPEVAKDLQFQSDNDRQWIVIALFLGLGFAQLIFGPLSESIGRKYAVYIGCAIFLIGSLLSLFATNFTLMIIGRVLQGIGAAGPRIICVTIVRDQYEGREMARIMSFIMAVFILVPAVAPALGQAVMMFADWRYIFVMFIIMTCIGWIWFALRQPETLPREKRLRFSLRTIWAGAKETCQHPVSFGYSLIAGLVFGTFVAYLSTAQQIFSLLYGITDLFPLYFAILALAIGAASLINGRLVMTLGIRRLSVAALCVMASVSISFWGFAYILAPVPPFWLTMVYLAIVFMAVGFLFGNTNAMAMEPLGHIAGTGSAVVGTIATLLSVALGTAIGQMFDETMLPLAGGFSFLSVIALGVMRITEKRRLKYEGQVP